MGDLKNESANNKENRSNYMLNVLCDVLAKAGEFEAQDYIKSALNVITRPEVMEQWQDELRKNNDKGLEWGRLYRKPSVKELSGNAVKMLYMLLQFSSKYNNIQVSLTELVKLTGMATKTAIKARNELIEKGYMKRIYEQFYHINNGLYMLGSGNGERDEELPENNYKISYASLPINGKVVHANTLIFPKK